MENQIILQAVFQSIRSTVDGGLRVSFDLDPSQADILSQIMKLKNQQLFLVISARKDEADSFSVDTKFDI